MTAGAQPPTSPATDLVVSYAFPPHVDTSAIVAAKRVRQRGRRVDVIQNAMTTRPTDQGLRRIAEDLVVRHAAIDSPTYFSAWSGIVRFVELGLEQALAWDREGPGYEQVHSRAHYCASHVLAARLRMLRPRVRWVAEFSDPLSHDVEGQTREQAMPDDALRRVLAEGIRRAGFTPPDRPNVYLWTETVAYALADEIVFTNDHQRELMTTAVDDPALRARIERLATVSPHPTPPPEAYSLADPALELEPGRRHLGYFGNLYATRGMGSVLEGLEQLPDALRRRLCLHVFTSSPETVQKEVAARGLADVVRPGPFVPYLDMLALCRRMDVLLVNDATTAGLLPLNPYLPSKWADYAGSGTPVWGMVEPGSVLSRQDLAYRSVVGFPTATVQVLAQIAAG